MLTQEKVLERLQELRVEFRKYALNAEKNRESSSDFNYQMAEKTEQKIQILEWVLETK